MGRDKGLIFGFLFLLAVLLVPSLHADDDDAASHARIVRVSYVDGQVQIAHNQQMGYENATMNMPLLEGDQVRTTAGGWAEIQFEDGSTIRLAPETQITFASLKRFSSGGTISEINLDQGEAEFQVLTHDDSDFRVNVAQRTIQLKHSSRFRLTSINSDPLDLTVWTGEVAVMNSDSMQQVTVKKNETFALDPDDAGRYDLEKEAQADNLDQFSKQRDDYLSSYTSGHTSEMLPYQYGLADLNYYGQYYSIPGYGYCWQPNGVGVGWDPYANGYWNYAPGFGYVWISSYPWGWMPFRYGQWVFVNGYGWVWQPGLWNRWAALPRFTNPPAGFRPPAPPPAVVSATSPNPARGSSFDAGPARMKIENPTLTTTTDRNGRPIISNEHSPVKTLREATGDGPSTAQPQVRAVEPTEGAGSPGERFHATPPVQTRPMATVPPQQPRVVNTPPPPPMHVAPPAPVFHAPAPVSRPQPSFSSPPRSFSPPPPPPPPPARSENSSGGRPHR